MDVYGQIEELGRMPIAELRERYQEVFGEQTTRRTNNTSFGESRGDCRYWRKAICRNVRTAGL